jgi:histidinol-phosphate aminotransferase
VSTIPNRKNIIGLLEPYDPGLFPIDITERYGIPREKIVNLSSNENPYSPPKSLIRRTARKLMSVNRYPDPSYKELKQSISEYVGLAADCIAVGNGSSDLIDLTCKILLSPLDKVVMPVPTYTLYILSSMMWETNITYVTTEEHDFTLRADELIPFLEAAKLVFLGSPNNPTGLCVSERELAEMLDATDAVIILDEAYCEFSGKTAKGLLQDHDNLIIVRSMSKFFCLAGLRVGYALSNPGIVEDLEKARLPFTINSLAESAAVGALRNLDYFRRIGRLIVSERIRLSKELLEIGLRPLPSEANFITVGLPQGVDADRFTEELASRGVIVRSLKGFVGLTGEFFRVTVGTREENGVFIEACERALRSAFN